MDYTFTISNAHTHFIEISIQENVVDYLTVSLQLPCWRPGRYELGDFAKNVKNFKVLDDKGNTLSFEKTTKDKWEINTENANAIKVSYLYYANELNAGSTFLDDNQLYVNPINCCMYIESAIDKQCKVTLDLPEDYRVATSMRRHKKDAVFMVDDFHELVDSPFICSSTIQSYSYESCGTTFHLCFQGEVKPDEKLLIADFKKFTDYQIEKFDGFPVKDYYFLFQITPYSSYHGVEHQKSTVILLGPSYAVFKNRYDSLLGISSHELYHTWNVKTIRPFDMLPYSYNKENYTHMGYVTEGVTTYMGDRLLYESEVFSLKQYFKELETLLTRHFHNDGRKHYSVAESSFDTWLDGYVPGIPGRKVSIYVEGALIALICDARIRMSTNNDFSLHTALKKLYSGTAELSGYDRNSYQLLVEKISGTSFKDIFEGLIYGKKDFSPFLKEAFDFWGWSYETCLSKDALFRYGIKALWINGTFKVSSILEGSSADYSGLVVDDKIHSINGYKLNNDINQWLDYFSNEQIVLSFERSGLLKRISLKPVNDAQYYTYKMLDNE
ncbi:MAG: hypothetical protein CMD01_00040 [Flavobacteriales bacterium]|nr:hypothetical protein [Flavobacteriales bacterium]